MGNGSSGKPVLLHGKAKLAASKFDLDEIHVLHKTWQDMSDRSNGKGEHHYLLDQGNCEGVTNNASNIEFDVEFLINTISLMSLIMIPHAAKNSVRVPPNFS